MEKHEMTVYVGNLPWRTTEDELAGLFAQFGTLSDVRIVQDPYTGRSRGYGFVEFTQLDPARRAMQALNGQGLGGRPLLVDAARPKRPRAGHGVVEPSA